MNHLRSILIRVASIGLLLIHLDTLGAESPSAMIQATIQRALSVLQNPSYQGNGLQKQRLAKLATAILLHFDTNEFARRSLGPYWRHLSLTEQQEFVRLFSSLVIRTYAETIDRHAKDVKVVYDKERIDGSYAEVNTRILNASQEQPVEVNYFLRQASGQWLIYDVQIEHISIALNYRSQFTRVIHHTSYAELVRKLKEKLVELGVSPS
jgi:phospholipid transport system substrate-binding protein